MSSETVNTPVQTLSHTILDRLFAGLSALRRIAGGTFETIQIGQMASALYNLDDDRLARLGVTRAQIPAYAEKMIKSGTAHR